jgi:hypothetical protein
MSDLDPVYQELAQRAVIPEIAPPGTVLVKVDSPGRLYEAKLLSEIAGGDEVYEAERFVLNETDIANKYVSLTNIPLNTSEISFYIQSAPHQAYGEDFKQDDVYNKRITWELLGLDGLLETGDIVTITYTREI